MTLKLFNTLRRKKEEFWPITEDEVRMYSCGPTVYNFSHIGNFRTFVFGDLLKRTLQYFGHNVRHVMNFTDVDDKTIKASIEQNIPLEQLTERYKKAFFEDAEKLRIKRADVYCSATEHIDEMVKLVEQLVDKGFAYRSEDGSVYFDVSKARGYGKLSRANLEGLLAGARVDQDEYDKAHARDFALWKAYSEEDGNVAWQSSFGIGRPGWHIECSAMSMKYLGEHFDIHIGGIDNMFPHHENEIVQSESATGHEFVKYWMHAQHLQVDGRKMSKSKGNFYTLRNLIDKGYDERVIRFFLISNAHYRSQVNLSDHSLHSAEMAVDKLDRFIQLLDEYIEKDAPVRDSIELSEHILYARKAFERHLADDLDMPRAMATVFSAINYVNRYLHNDTLFFKGKGISRNDAYHIKGFMQAVDTVADFLKYEDKIEQMPDFSEQIAERERLRAEGRFHDADYVRDTLIRKGYYIDDTRDGPKLRPLRKTEKSYIILDVLAGYA